MRLSHRINNAEPSERIAFQPAIEMPSQDHWISSQRTIGGGSAEDLFKAIMEAPVVRCDEVQWALFGISMAGWNAILSLGSALVILWLSLKRPRAA